MKKNRKQILRYCILEIRESISVLFFISIGGCVLCLALDNWDMLKLISNQRNTLGVAEYRDNSFSWGFYGIFVFAAKVYCCLHTHSSTCWVVSDPDLLLDYFAVNTVHCRTDYIVDFFIAWIPTFYDINHNFCHAVCIVVTFRMS